MIQQIINFLGFLLFFAPFASALEYSWEPINIQNTSVFILSLGLGYTALQINEILKSYFGEYLESEAEPFPDSPGNDDFDNFLDDFLSSPFLSSPKTKGETLVQTINRLASQTELLVPEQQPSRRHRHGAVKRIIVVLKALFSSLQLNQQYAKQNEEYKNALEQARDEQNRYMEPLIKLLPAADVFGNSPQQVAYSIKAYVEREFNKIIDAFPADIRGKRTFDEPGQISDLVQILAKTQKLANRMTARMSLDPTPGINLAAFWTDIPEAVRGNSPMPTSEDDARAFLRSLTNVHSNPNHCTHPVELATTLNKPQQNWQDSLEEVEQLVLQPAPAAPTGIPVFMTKTAPTPEQGLFKSTEVPSLTKKSNYWTWRSATQRFLEGVTVRDDQVHFALTRIVGRFEGEVTERASNWNLRTISHLPWTQAYALFFAELDRMFLAPDYYNKELAKFYSCKPTPGQTAQDFLGSFQTRVQTLNAVANVQNEPPLDDREIARQLLRIIPGNIRGILQMHEEHVNALSLDRLIHRLTTLWNNAPTTLTGSSNNQNKNTTSRAAIPSETTHSFGTCNKPCWGTSPEVPQEKRGLARPGGILRKELKDVCLKCRRGKAAHNGTKIGCVIPGNHDRHNAPSAKQEPEQGKVEGIE